MSTEIHISSLLVHCHAGQLPSIASAIDGLPEAEVQASDPCGKLIVTLETGSETALRDRLDAIRCLSGVLTTSLVFHQVEQA